MNTQMSKTKQQIYDEVQHKIHELVMKYLDAQEAGEDLTDLDRQLTIAQQIFDRLHTMIEIEKQEAA